MRPTIVQRCVWLCLGFALANAASMGQAVAEVDEAWKVKAAYVYQFSKFVQWPDQVLGASEQPFRICVLGDNPMKDALQPVVGKPVKDHRLVVHIPKSPTALEGCRVVFLSGVEPAVLTTVLTSLRKAPVLTVGDAAGFVEQGGMLGLVMQERRIRFGANLRAAKEAGLEMDFRLLSMALAVRR